MTRLHNKIFRETTLTLKNFYKLRKSIVELITKNQSTFNVHYISKISSISAPSKQSLVQGKDRADLKELRFISSLSTFSRLFHMTAPLQLKARLAASVQGLGTKTLFEAPRTL